MKKCIVIPDSYKGTLSSLQICLVMKQSILERFPSCDVVEIPVADGGEGTVECFLQAMPGKRVTVCAKGPFFEDVKADYALIQDGRTAIVELASCAGLPMAEGRLDPANATTYGVGAVMLDAVSRGCTEIIAGIGGSCTNDGGAGLAAAMGAKFYDSQGKPFVPTGGTLHRIARIDTGPLRQVLGSTRVTVMCDVDNPLLGARGAARVFSPQKGADAACVEMLEENLCRYAGLLQQFTGISVAQMPGAGAAGGVGAGLAALLGGRLTPGIDVVLDTVGFAEKLRGCDCVFTGEGRFDSQSLGGKVVVGVARRSRPVPVCAVVGGIEGGLPEAYEEGVTALFSINPRPEEFSTSRLKSEENLRLTMRNLLRMIQAIEIRQP